MKNTKIIVSAKDLHCCTTPLAVVLLDEKQNIASFLDKQIKRKIKKILSLGDFVGKKEEQLLLYGGGPDSKDGLSVERLLLVGIGDTNKDDNFSILESLRSSGGIIARVAEKVKTTDIMVVLPDYLKKIPSFGAEQIVEGILLGDYQFRRYKTSDNKEKSFAGIKKLSVLTKKNVSGIRKVVKRAQYVAEAALSARDMANEPGNKWTPQQFVDFARKIAKRSTLKCKVLNLEQMKKAGMGGIIAVSQGSAIPPKLVILEHTPRHYSKTILLVGKGLTFDSGGISIKPAVGMEDMKYDMCGGAAVLSAMQAIAVEKPNVKVVAIVPSSENLSGSMAVKPGDVITHYNGVTSEIVNTDAEGRLILADALSYGIDKYKPNCVVDLATLTGAVIISLGHHRTGLMSNNDRLADTLAVSGETVGEPIWRLPLGKEYSKQIESDVADIKNVGGREGGSITAAAYLEKFVGTTPWAHMDIAGTAWGFTKKTYIPKGPSGTGVRTLIEFIRKWQKAG